MNENQNENPLPGATESQIQTSTEVYAADGTLLHAALETPTGPVLADTRALEAYK